MSQETPETQKPGFESVERFQLQVERALAARVLRNPELAHEVANLDIRDVHAIAVISAVKSNSHPPGPAATIGANICAAAGFQHISTDDLIRMVKSWEIVRFALVNHTVLIQTIAKPFRKH